MLRAALAFLLAVPAIVPASATAAPPRAEVGVASSLEKLRPADPAPAARQVDLALARGECEAAQIAVRARRGLAALSAAATPLSGPPGARPLEATLSRVATLKLDRPSGPDGAPGEWPDPLVPVRDPWFREARRAFPLRVAPGRLQAIWVEVCAPAEARPGRYAGAVTVSERGATLAEVPVAIEVWPFTLPATGRFVAAFGLSTRLGTRTLGAPDDPEVARALAAAALRHRVTPFTLSADPPDGRCTASACELDWSRYDAEEAPVLDGTLVAGVKGGFAEVRISGPVWSGPEADLLATLRAWKRHFEERGWADRLWLYTLDEPGPAQYPELQRRARLARKAGIRVFVTTAPTPSLAGVVDAWAPNLTRVEDGAPRPARLSFSYASCLSHGCAELPASGPQRAAFQREFAGWPGYEIDRPGTAARAVAWLAARRGLAGELYYDMLQAWRGDPWTDVRAFAGNGDGTLLYPGRPEALGGRHPFPVESQRLAIIRDALEDLELLTLARAAGLSALCDETLAKLVPSGRAWERRPEPWLEARRRIAEALARRTAER